MFWTKLKAIAMASAIVLAIGLGAGQGWASVWASPLRTFENLARQSRTRPLPPGPRRRRPRSNTGHLVKDYDDAMEAHARLGEKAKNQAELEEIYKDRPLPGAGVQSAVPRPGPALPKRFRGRRCAGLDHREDHEVLGR